MVSGHLDWVFAAAAAPFLAAAVAPVIHRLFGAAAGWVLAVVPAAMFAYFLSLTGAVSTNEQGFVVSAAWVPAYGVELSYLLDGLSVLFALLITGIGTFIIIYAGGYLKGHPHQGRFLSFMFLFMGAMLGVVIADNLITLFIYWELTSITSFLLIGFDHARTASRRAALQALVVTGAGGLALLAGFLLIMGVTDQASMSGLIGLDGALRDHALYMPILILVLGGAFTKSAQFPLHFWLPNAMEAPTPVSAYLHSATMVKAGVYLLMRMHPILGETEAWTTILPLFGGATLIVGTTLALRQTDLKLILAYTTVASLGLLVMLTGTSLHHAIEGAVLYLFAHSLFKGGLFMVAGAVDHESGTRDITKLGGLRTAMPVTFVAAFVAAWSMGGLPLTIGFFAKETLYHALIADGWWITLVLLVAIAGNAMMFAAGFAVATKPFFGARKPTPKSPHEGPVSLWIGPLTLAILGVVAIVAGQWVSTRLLSPMAFSISRISAEIPVSIAIHFNLALALSVVTVALGLLILWQLDRARALMASLLRAIGWGPDHGFDQFIRTTIRLATLVTRIIQPGRMEYYLSATFLVTAAVLLVPLFAFEELPQWPQWPHLFFYEWTVLVIAVLGLIAVIIARTRLVAIVSLGIQGFAVAMIFMLFGAPDLSFTQFMVETLSVVILALVMTRLRLVYSDHRAVREVLKDGVIAIACGAGFALLLLSVTQGTFDPRLSEFFAANSRVIAHGRNIVNVIIVDYRGLDTLGEIAVVMVAGLAILALIRVRSGGRRPVPVEEGRGDDT